MLSSRTFIKFLLQIPIQKSKIIVVIINSKINNIVNNSLTRKSGEMSKIKILNLIDLMNILSSILEDTRGNWDLLLPYLLMNIFLLLLFLLRKNEQVVTTMYSIYKVFNAIWDNSYELTIFTPELLANKINKIIHCISLQN